MEEECLIFMVAKNDLYVCPRKTVRRENINVFQLTGEGAEGVTGVFLQRTIFPLWLLYATRYFSLLVHGKNGRLDLTVPRKWVILVPMESLRRKNNHVTQFWQAPRKESMTPQPADSTLT